MSAADEELRKLVKRWLQWDKNETTRLEVEGIVERREWFTLEQIMKNRLTFGTAGIRGRMGPGFGQMNDLVIIQTTQGLKAYLEKQNKNLKTAGVVFSFDGRHHSHRWAKLSAGVFLRAGIPVYLYLTTTPTPFVPFTVVQMGAAAGVMVTASHNPKWDNGYKVYWENGAQILSPHDKNIQEEILQNLQPEEGAFEEPSPDHPLLKDPMETVYYEYFKKIQDNAMERTLNSSLSTPIVYTAMHGVGHPYVKQAWQSAGFKDETLVSVEEQKDPDPEFSTVDFPNPEEGASALDLSFKKADSIGSRYIIANDPDADRLGVAQKVRGEWKILSGNQIGALLGWWLLRVFRGKNPGVNMGTVNFLASTVSSKFLNTLCGREGAVFTETLTGFKHMGNISDKLIQGGETVLFAFEEAIGFMCGSAVLDKDGVSAAAVVGELIAFLEARKSSLLEKLDELYTEYGYHYTLNSYYLCYDPSTTDKIFTRIRSYQEGRENTYPTSLGSQKVVNIRDLTTGYDSSTPDKLATLPTSRSSHMITFWLENGVVITLRTSGTEPKIKYYTEYCAKPGLDSSEWSGLEEELQRIVEATVEDLLQPAENCLKPKPA